MRNKPPVHIGQVALHINPRGFASLLVVLAILGPIFAVRAQGVDCQRLRADIDASASDVAQAGQFASALRQRRSELERTRDYADSIGCNSGLFDDAPPQCDGISARIEQMQDRLEQLQQQQPRSADLDDGGRRRALTERYNEACRTAPDSQIVEPAEAPRLIPVDPDGATRDDAAPAEAPPVSQQESKALCVRHCDGGFFPITDQAAPDKLDRLDQLCKALCPNAEASLYTTGPSGGIETAVAPDGAAYTALPAAFKYQKTHDPTCSCKPPHQSWAEALVGAEQLLDGDKNDVVVTQQLSDAMSRPAAPVPPASPGRSTTKPGKNRSLPVDQITVPDRAPVGPRLPSGENAGEEIMRQLRQAGPKFCCAQ